MVLASPAEPQQPQHPPANQGGVRKFKVRHGLKIQSPSVVVQLLPAHIGDRSKVPALSLPADSF